MPLFGSQLNFNHLLTLSKKYVKIILWLDSNKLKESIKQSNKLKAIGIKSKSIYSLLDPKKYTDKEIKEYLI